MVSAQQVFAAPGDADEPLPAMYPPWSIDREVYLPLWDWYLILDQAAQRDAELGRLLAASSGSADPAASGIVDLSTKEASALIAFIERLADEFEAGVDLRKEQAERELGDYDSAVYASMLRAVAAIIRESQRLGKPFEAWNE